MRVRRLTTAAAALTGAALILTACSGGGDGSGGSGGEGGEVQPLTIHANSSNSYQRNFNPFSTSVLHGARGMIYEPLVASSPQFEEPVPWLAESVEFNDDGTVMTYTLRDGVTWSDGEEFNAEDVEFTFTMFVDQPATNLSALDVVGATATDDLTVEIEFSEPMFAFEHAVGNSLIVPEHIWSEIEDPIETTNEEPVGTGPFLLEDFEQQLYTMTKNEDYWAADEVEVEQLRYPANTDQTFTTSLQAGEIDWSGGFVANIDDIFVAQDPENRGYWYPGGGLVSLTPNTQEAPFDDPELREALSLAMDRDQISEVAMQGYTPAAHPTGLPQPAYQDSLSADYADAAFARDVEAANQILDDAGYERGADGVRTTPDGEAMSYPLEIPSDWVDWVTISQLLVEQYAEVGIEIVPQGVSFEAWVETRNSGNFALTISATAIGQSPFDMYRSMMSSEYASDGAVRQNFSRFYNDDADAALDAYAGTDDEAEQQAALDSLEQIMVEQLPLVPMIQSPNWFQYTSERWEGWPTEENPYAFGAPFQNPDIMLVVRNLTPAQ
ncbi:ABC transporter substrate-binding protein [Ruania zhangjianzhongii]|uniref:ABC transporter substrate-binding protein n=1 Tax=Ruania zhangjianzhongii TaxID=2603206 RepID=UPI0011CA426C|nr:ABC transporter substrate-binding protein [Ruania zhangjianzhongii]